MHAQTDVSVDKVLISVVLTYSVTIVCSKYQISPHLCSCANVANQWHSLMNTSETCEGHGCASTFRFHVLLACAIKALDVTPYGVRVIHILLGAADAENPRS